MANGAHNVQPEIKSNDPISTAPAMAPFLVPKRMETIKSIAVPDELNLKYVALNCLMFFGWS